MVVFWYFEPAIANTYSVTALESKTIVHSKLWHAFHINQLAQVKQSY